jgi:hypothetical protein
LRDYNNLIYNKGETIKSFNLCFTKLYNQIPEIIRPHNQAALMHYYNALPSSYHHRLEEKNANSLGSTLQTCLEFEEQLTRTGLPVEDYIKQTDMSIVLQLVQDMSNRMISFERKGVASTSAETSTQATLRNQPQSFQPKEILSRAWCNFCEENHDENTCEVRRNAREWIFGKISDTTIVALDWAPEEDVMMVDTQNKSYQNKNKGGPQKTTFSPSTSSHQTDSQVTRGTQQS